MNKLRFLVGASVLACAMSGGAAEAAVCTWNGGVHSWDYAAGWSCGRQPNSSDSARIGSNGLVTAAGVNADARDLWVESGSRLGISGNGSLAVQFNHHTIDGIVSIIGSAASLSGAAPITEWAGTGQIRMEGGTFASLATAAQFTIDGSLSIKGYGNVGLNKTMFANAGTIWADAAGQTLTIDPYAGPNGSEFGLGTSGKATFVNSGDLRADAVFSGVARLDLKSGLYENTVTGRMAADNGSSITMLANANLANLNADGNLSIGTYSVAYDAALTLRAFDNSSEETTAITSLGRDAGGGIDTVVHFGPGGGTVSVLSVANPDGRQLADTLTRINRTAELDIADGQFNATANGNFIIDGDLTLGSGKVSGNFVRSKGLLSIGNTGEVSGFGTLQTPSALLMNGTIRASGGTLHVLAGAAGGNGGIWQSDENGTLDLKGLTGKITLDTLNNQGYLDIGNRTITVTHDYYDPRLGDDTYSRYKYVDRTTGVINAAEGTSYALESLTGGALPGTIALGGIRVGDAVPLAGVANTSAFGLHPIIRGTTATTAGLYSFDNQQFALDYNEKTTVSLFAQVTGKLSGTLNISTNFANLADKSVVFNATAYQAAVAIKQAESIDLGSVRVGGTLSQAFIFSNDAPSGEFTETLTSDATASGPFRIGGGTEQLVKGMNGGSVYSVLSLVTKIAGSFEGTLDIANTSVAIAGSGLSNLVLDPQTIMLTGKVYAPAMARLSTLALDLGYVRPGETAGGTVTVSNDARGKLTDTLQTRAGERRLHRRQGR